MSIVIFFDLIVVGGPDGDELTIWDSNESEFASGLEYSEKYRWIPWLAFTTPVLNWDVGSELILDLDWSSTPNMQSILAVGYAHRVEIICQQRMTYFAEQAGWGLYRTIDISGCAFLSFMCILAHELTALPASLRIQLVIRYG